ncbi:unnamed protein product [Polarella glacialis]|uniref:Ankyrin repeat domain-containing protein n=1 Tax=Polarella glacialis TaxID=89957 RepID=A0A813HD51_POLGL|nr:unnamed protein product [Polarella glacialis]
MSMSALEAWRADPVIAEVIAEVSGDSRGAPFPELHYAVQTGRADIVAELLADGADVNKQLDDDRVPLPAIQIMPGFGICITAEITKMLLAAQADVNLGEDKGYSDHRRRYGQHRGREADA